MVREDRFRLDLYYRIRGVTIELPPLRDRDGDALLLARHFLASMAAGSPPARLAPDAVRLIQSYDWPGNVRELENALRGAALFSDGGVIRAEHLERFVEPERPAYAASVGAAPVADAEAEFQDPGFSLDEARRQMEVRFIAAALERTNGNITRAAELLKMTRPRLSQKIKEYDIPIRAGRDRRTI
jgi:DNA-binding NtrC family response regulator